MCLIGERDRDSRDREMCVENVLGGMQKIMSDGSIYMCKVGIGKSSTGGGGCAGGGARCAARWLEKKSIFINRNGTKNIPQGLGGNYPS